MTPRTLPSYGNFQLPIDKTNGEEHVIYQTEPDYIEALDDAVVRFARPVNECWDDDWTERPKSERTIIVLAMDNHCDFWIANPIPASSIVEIIPYLNCDAEQAIYTPWREQMELVSMNRLIYDDANVDDLPDASAPDFSKLGIDTRRKRLADAGNIWLFDFDRLDNPFQPLMNIVRSDLTGKLNAIDVDLPFYDAEAVLKALSQCGLFSITLDYDTNLLTQRYRRKK